MAIEADIGDEEQAKSLVEKAHAELGGLDTLVNNAGVMLLGPLQGADPAEWRTMIEVNLLGLLYCTHYALPLIRDGGGGDVVNVSSVAGRTASSVGRLNDKWVCRLLGSEAGSGTNNIERKGDDGEPAVRDQRDDHG